MHDIVEFLKSVVERNPSIAIKGCYLISDGAMHAIGNSMHAGLNVGWNDGAFNVPADAMDRQLSRMKEIESIRVNDDGTIKLTAGRLRATIKCVAEPAPGPPDFPDEWSASPPGLAQAIALAAPFVSTDDDRWTSGVRIGTGRVTAITNFHGIDVKLEGLDLEAALISKSVADFIIAQGDPDELVREERSLSFRWNDGRWCRAQLLDTEMPMGVVDRIFDGVGMDGIIDIDNSWREAYEDAVALSSNGIIRVSREGFATKNDTTDAFVDYPMDVLSEDHISYWDSKYVGKAIAVATSWNPIGYPNPALFLGPNFRGIVMGRSRW